MRCEKATFRPSYVLCPITLTWVPLEVAKQILETEKFSRFAGSHLPRQPPSYHPAQLVQWARSYSLIINGTPCLLVVRSPPEPESYLHRIESYRRPPEANRNHFAGVCWCRWRRSCRETLLPLSLVWKVCLLESVNKIGFPAPLL